MNTPSMISEQEQGMDWGSLVLLGNDIAMQWYAMTHDTVIPPPQVIPGTRIPTQVYTQTTTLIVVGLVAVAAIVLLRK